MHKKILQILDVPDWAISKLASPMRQFNPQYDWRVRYIHPKDLEFGKVDLAPIIEDIKWADLIDCHYWRVLSQLLELIPELKDKKILLTHHNEKNILSYKWPANVSHFARTEYIKEVLKKEYPNAKSFFVNNSFDPDIFQYNEEYPPAEKMVGYVGRIVPWKGLKEIAGACYELGYPLLVMGKMDKPSYYAEIPKEHQDNIHWDYFNCDDKDVPDFYKNITCYVGFSGSGRETGPLGLIEAMASGVPVITTLSGIAKDICVHEENSLVVDFDDYDSLKENISLLMESPALQAKYRKAGWEDIRNHTHERVAIEYNKAYVKLLNDKPLVSVIIPTTYDRGLQVYEIVEALKKQTYDCIEAIIVCDEMETEKGGLALDTPFPVKQLFTNRQGYNLAMARNMGAIEASGKYLWFCDSRLKPLPNALESFLRHITLDSAEKVWLFGKKGGDKQHFVENFSLIERDQFIRAGMMNERVNAYGGMSQELRARFASQGFKLGYVPEAEAEEMTRNKPSNAKRRDIIRMKTLLAKMNLP